jgi:L-lactate dehydrogenase complex protein LldG
MSAREHILGRIRAANAGHRVDGVVSAQNVASHLSNRKRGPLPGMKWERLARFKQCSIEAASTVDEVGSRADVPAAVAAYFAKHELPPTGVCWPELGELDWRGAGLEIEARPANGDDKSGITGSYCGLAETGTLVLLSGAQTHATTSLLPDTHIALVSASRIVACMEDVWDLFRQEIGDFPRQVNFVSGPSRTADIEMTLVYGAHGPFRVHVIIVDE